MHDRGWDESPYLVGRTLTSGASNSGNAGNVDDGLVGGLVSSHHPGKDKGLGSRIMTHARRLYMQVWKWGLTQVSRVWKSCLEYYLEQKSNQISNDI